MERNEIARRYLEALGLKRRAPDLPFLSEIQRRHVAEFAFCSVGPRLGDDLPLDVGSLFDRIVGRRRGGYCFEQNGLLFEMLEELGFAATLYLARVIYDQEIHPGLTHRITLVEIDGQRHVVDVGFGPLGPGQPVSMAREETQDGDRRFRVAEPRSGEFHLQTLKDGEFFSLYRFELVRYGQADCEVGHFYSHRHPDATFVNHLVVSRIMDREIRSLRDRQFRVVDTRGDRTREIGDADELRGILDEQFGIRVSEAESHKLFASSS